MAHNEMGGVEGGDGVVAAVTVPGVEQNGRTSSDSAARDRGNNSAGTTHAVVLIRHRKVGGVEGGDRSIRRDSSIQASRCTVAYGGSSRNCANDRVSRAV